MSTGTYVDHPLVLNPYTGTIGGFIGLLADRSSQRASLDELNEAYALKLVRRAGCKFNSPLDHSFNSWNFDSPGCALAGAW